MNYLTRKNDSLLILQSETHRDKDTAFAGISAFMGLSMLVGLLISLFLHLESDVHTLDGGAALASECDCAGVEPTASNTGTCYIQVHCSTVTPDFKTNS